VRAMRACSRKQNRRRRNKPYLYELFDGLDYTPTPIQLKGCLPIAVRGTGGEVQLAQKIQCYCQLPCTFPTQNRCQLAATLPQFAITVGSVATQNRTDCHLLPSALGSPANWQNKVRAGVDVKQRRANTRVRPYKQTPPLYRCARNEPSLMERGSGGEVSHCREIGAGC
jgi:hypothetical protein